MKICFAATYAVLLALLLATPALADLDQGLVGHYTFSGDATDSSNTGNDGEVSGATLVEDRFGNLNSAYYFNGTDAYIEIPYSQTFDPTYWSEGTVSVWFKPQAYAPSLDNTNILSNVGNSGLAGFEVRLITESERSFHVGLKDGTSPNFYNLYANPTIDLGTWYHAVMVYSGSTVSLYFDGELITSTSTKEYSGSRTVLNNLTIGCKPEMSQWFTGSIDDIRIYHRALSEEEITELFEETEEVVCECCDQNGDGVANARDIRAFIANCINEKPAKTKENDPYKAFLLDQIETLTEKYLEQE